MNKENESSTGALPELPNEILSYLFLKSFEKCESFTSFIQYIALYLEINYFLRNIMSSYYKELARLLAKFKISNNELDNAIIESIKAKNYYILKVLVALPQSSFLLYKPNEPLTIFRSFTLHRPLISFNKNPSSLSNEVSFIRESEIETTFKDWKIFTYYTADLIKESHRLVPLLHFAILEDWYKGVELLLKQGADVNTRDYAAEWVNVYNGSKESPTNYYEFGKQNSRSALSLAVRNNQLRITELLLEKGADYNSEEADLLDLAIGTHIRNSNFEMVKILIDHGMNATTPSFYGTVLHSAVRCRNENITPPNKTKLLYSSFGPFFKSYSSYDNLVDFYNRYNLSPWSHDGNLQIIELLLEYLPIDSRDKKNNTALHLAVEYNNLELVTVFLEKRANPLLTNIKGYTPLDVARNCIERATFCKSVLNSLRGDKKILAKHGININEKIAEVNAEIERYASIARCLNDKIINEEEQSQTGENRSGFFFNKTFKEEYSKDRRTKTKKNRQTQSKTGEKKNGHDLDNSRKKDRRCSIM